MEDSEHSDTSDTNESFSSEMESETSSESGETSKTDEEESASGNSNVHKSTQVFKLNCLDNLDVSNMKQKSIYSWLENGPDLSTLSKIHLEEISGKAFDNDFTPWWDAITERKQDKEMETFTQNNKGDASHNNWFNKFSFDNSNWLSGPSCSSKLVQNETAPVEDIDVPSIYDKKPKPKGRRAMKRERKAAREETTGKKWYDMKLPDVDSKTKMDMDIIRMRSVLDPKRFYKHNDRKGMPKYFQMGTVVDEGTDFYSSRLTKKQRKQTLVEELMADADVRQYNKRKYAELQHKQRGKKFKTKKK